MNINIIPPKFIIWNIEIEYMEKNNNNKLFLSLVIEFNMGDGPSYDRGKQRINIAFF